MMIEVKICENCNHKNPVNAVECEQCGYDLTFVFPQMIEDTPEQSGNKLQESGNNRETCIMNQEEDSSGWKLVSCENDALIHPVLHEESVGRDCDVFNDLFNRSNYTSRKHAKIRVMDGSVQVMDASTNGTFIDDNRIPKMEWTNVPAESTLRFADISFVVRRSGGAD